MLLLRIFSAAGCAAQGLAGWSRAEIQRALRDNSTPSDVELSCTWFGSEGLKDTFKALAENTSCKHLYLNCSGIGDDEARVLADALKRNTTLESLTLAGNHIGDSGAKEIADALRVNNSLRKLDLNGNLITDEGAKYLAAALEVNSTLQKFHLQDTSITEIGVQHLQAAAGRNGTLQVVDVGGCLSRSAVGAKAKADLCDAVKNPPSALEFSEFGKAYAEALPYANVAELCAGVEAIVKGICTQKGKTQAQANGLSNRLRNKIHQRSDGKVSVGAAVAWTSPLETDGSGPIVRFYTSVQVILRKDEPGPLLDETARFSRSLNLLLLGRRAAEPAQALALLDKMWLFLTDAQLWQPFPTEDSNMLEKAFGQGILELRTSDLSFNQQHQTPYVFDFINMTQLNTESGTRRRLRRQPRSGATLPTVLPPNAVTFRAGWLPRKEVEWLTKDKMYRYAGYLASSDACSVSMRFLTDFLPSDPSFDIPVLFLFHFDKDHGCRHVNLLENITEVAGESEWLFQAYSSFQVRKAADFSAGDWDASNPIIVEIDVVPDNSAVSAALPLATHH